MNRRELIKFFSAGALITPLAASAPVARIIEPPKVELFKEIPARIDLTEVQSVSVRFSMKDGSARELHMSEVNWASGFIDPAVRVEVRVDASGEFSPITRFGWISASR